MALDVTTNSNICSPKLAWTRQPDDSTSTRSVGQYIPPLKYYSEVNTACILMDHVQGTSSRLGLGWVGAEFSLSTGQHMYNMLHTKV